MEKKAPPTPEKNPGAARAASAPRPVPRPAKDAPKAQAPASSKSDDASAAKSEVSEAQKADVGTSAPAAADPSPPTPATGLVVAGKYRLESMLSQGGMGSVWVAKHLALGEPVAIKFMVATLGLDEALTRFQREAKAAARLRSTNVVQVLDYGIDRGLPYLVMELLHGEDLRARIKRINRLSPLEVFRIMLPVCRALERAHTSGLVHRDLKPENIFLSSEGDQEVPKILDFGIARTAHTEDGDESMTQAGTVLGSPHYMSPEQATAALVIDHRSDLWSVAVILFRALTGKHLFPGRSAGDCAVQICTGPIKKARSLVPDLPEAIDEFFEHALKRNPRERYQSARELIHAFGEAAGLNQLSIADIVPETTPGHSVASGIQSVSRETHVLEAPDPPPPQRRRRLAAVVAGAVVLSIVIAVSVSLTGRKPAAAPDLSAVARANAGASLGAPSASAPVAESASAASPTPSALASAQPGASVSASALRTPTTRPAKQKVGKASATRDVGY
jgi:eukaryotic-like serine/threonine-protein kinase